MDPKTKIFVYGTLKSGHGNNLLLDNAKLIETEAYLIDHKMYNVHDAFPAIVPINVGEERTNVILGEVYQVTDSIMDSVNKLEGYPGWYKRKMIVYVDSKGISIGMAYVYYFENKEDIGYNVYEQDVRSYKSWDIYSWWNDRTRYV